MKATDWQEVIGTIGLFALVLIVVTSIIWQFGAAWRLRAVTRSAAQYQQLADRSVTAQENTATRLTEHGEVLAELRTRLQAVEHILKDAE
jgi:uncharacterized membrane protein YcjF (UPF0283 family)